jgi:hypothetical protein
MVSFVPTLIVVGFVYAIDHAGDSALGVFRLTAAGWLLAHGVPLRTGNGSVGLVPLVISVLVAWRVTRAGVHTARAIGARRSPATLPTLSAGLAVGVVYATIGAAMAAAARLPGLSVSVGRAAITLGGFGVVAGLIGAASESGLLARAAAAIPSVVRDGARTGAVAALLVLGGGAATAGMAVAVAGGEASWVLHEYGAGVVGQTGLTFVCVLYGPNIAVWAASYLIGPGFVLGTDTTISAARVTLGELPTVPVLAGLEAIPERGSLLLALPLAAGMTAGWLLVRRIRRARVRRRWETTPLPAFPPWPTIFGAGGIAGVVAGVAIGLASIASAGSLGSGRLETIGPRVVPVTLVGALVVALGVVVAAIGCRLLYRPAKVDSTGR